MKKIEEKKQFNILSNQRYRLYIFWIFYKFTFPSNKQIDKKIRDYESNKLLSSIMASYNEVLSKIYFIRTQPHNDELEFFIIFLCSCPKVK
jgi:hypothetical protein